MSSFRCVSLRTRTAPEPYTRVAGRRELNCETDLKKPHVLLHELDPGRGGDELPVLNRQCLENLSEEVHRFIFEDGNLEVIEWHRLNDYMIITLRKIAEVMLRATSQYSELPAGPFLYVPGEMLMQDFTWNVPVVLSSSADNRGAATVVKDLAQCSLFKAQSLMVSRGAMALQGLTRNRSMGSFRGSFKLGAIASALVAAERVQRAVGSHLSLSEASSVSAKSEPSDSSWGRLQLRVRRGSVTGPGTKGPTSGRARTLSALSAGSSSTRTLDEQEGTAMRGSIPHL